MWLRAARFSAALFPAVLLATLLALVGCQPAPQQLPIPSSRVALRGGPVADYELLAGIALHQDTDEMAPELRPTLKRLLGQNLFVAQWSAASRDPDDGPDELDGSLRWLRDYQPIYVRDPLGKLFAVRYLSENPNRSAFRIPAPGRRRVGQTWIPGRRGGTWIPVRTLPLLHENGNLLVVGRRIIVSDKLIADNAIDRTEPHLRKQGYRARSRHQILQLLAHTLQREEKDILVVPPLPYESTEHVDVFLLPLDANTVMVPRIEERALRRTRGEARVVGGDVRSFLDEQAEALEEIGLTVPRWPMLPPAVTYATPDGIEVTEEEANEVEADLELLVFSPANALLMNLAAARDGLPARLALLPRFDQPFADPTLNRLSHRYAENWKRVLEQRGFRASFVESDNLVSYLGLLHCVSAPIPVP